MSFKVKDLSTTWRVSKEDHSWIVQIGCGVNSAKGHGNTQSKNVKRVDPIDFMSGIKTRDDLEALRLAVHDLQEWIDKQLENPPPPRPVEE